MQKNERREVRLRGSKKLSGPRPGAVQFFFLLLALAAALPVAAAERRTPVVNAIEKARPAVVNIRTEQVLERRTPSFFGFSDPFFEEFFRGLSPPRQSRTHALGSGVIIDPRGYVLTNAHVLAKASKIYVALTGRDGETEATLVGKNERLDLAVLKLSGEEEYPFLRPGDSLNLLLGETVIAIGNPLGLGHSVTTGIVSATRRRMPLEEDNFAIFIQTDALINPGNSGGPLINLDGELIGINTAIARRAQGIGFALPIATVKRVVDDLMAFGRVRQGYLGIIPGPLSEAFARQRGAGGVLVESVAAGSPAAAAGLRAADVVLALDGEPVATGAQYAALLATYTPGDRLGIRYLRETEIRNTEAELATLPEGYGLRYARQVFGLEVDQASEAVVISAVVPDSAAARTGLEAGDLITAVAGEKVRSGEEFARIVERHIGREPLEFLVVRGPRGYRLKLP